MTETTYDHSGRLLPSPPRHDDGWQYNVTGTTQHGDEVYSDYGGRWLPVKHIGFHMPDCLRYRRKKKQ
jgi:hypothetical protein